MNTEARKPLDVSRPLKLAYAQTFLSHGLQTEVETSHLWCVLHPFYSKSQVANAKMRALQLIGRAWKGTKSKNINFRLTSVAQKRLCLSSLLSSRDVWVKALLNIRCIVKGHIIFAVLRWMSVRWSVQTRREEIRSSAGAGAQIM